jgi:hypothetical protein
MDSNYEGSGSNLNRDTYFSDISREFSDSLQANSKLDQNRFRVHVVSNSLFATIQPHDAIVWVTDGLVKTSKKKKKELK